MSVDELQALTHQFAGVSDQRDLQMLLCLDREQRLTFILGAIFGVGDSVAAEVLEITPDNFRRLARARRDLRNFMNDKCGLVNQANPCRCAKKTVASYKRATPIPRTFCSFASESARCGKPHRRCMKPSAPWMKNCAEVYRGHSFYKAPNLGPMLRRLVERPDLKLNV